jgi:hypothetical protein
MASSVIALGAFFVALLVIRAPRPVGMAAAAAEAVVAEGA